MSTTFELRKSKKVGYAAVQVRVQSSVLGINIRLSTKLKVSISKWNLSRDSRLFKQYATSKEGIEVFEKLAIIANTINKQLALGVALTSNDIKQIVNNTIYTISSNIPQSYNRETINSNNTSLNEYYSLIIKEMENGTRHSNKGTLYSKGTINAFKQTFNQLQYFQKENNVTIDFQDINMDFYHKYTKYLESKDYTLNSIGKCISFLKAVLRSAECEGINRFTQYKDKRFKASSTETDAIYLTHEELKKLIDLDLSDTNDKLYEYVRDIFIVGVWTAQRVSDYNNISPNCIKRYERNFMVDGKYIKKEMDVIEIIQKKTKIKVTIPISRQLSAILKKYNYILPNIKDITINRYIKEIAKKAGINQSVEIVKISGGKYKKIHKPKYELIYTHTARRTGATLMYLAGMDVYDIMKITGHSSPEMLKKYIKANSLDVADKIVSKYDYFK